MNNSILTDIKKTLGIQEEVTVFDPEIIIHINSVLASLVQIGVGPKDGFTIVDKSNEWNEFIGDEKLLSSVKTYVYLKVRLIFDPPTSSIVKDAFEKQIAEFEWRNFVIEDNKKGNKLD